MPIFPQYIFENIVIALRIPKKLGIRKCVRNRNQ